MTQIVITFLLALLCLILFLVFFLKRTDAGERSDATSQPFIAGVSALRPPHLDVLFKNDDYRKLSGRPELNSVRLKLRLDRRRIALLWLGDLRRDVHVLWEFRRFLVRNGLHVTFRDEVGILFDVWFALLYLAAVRGVVLLFGPLDRTGVLRSARLAVENPSNRGSGLLARVPEQMRTQIEHRWAQHILVLD